MNKIYIIQYSSGQYEDYREVALFGVKTKEEAKITVSDFNSWMKMVKDSEPEFGNSDEDWDRKDAALTEYYKKLKPPMGLDILKEDLRYSNDGRVSYYELEVK